MDRTLAFKRNSPSTACITKGFTILEVMVALAVLSIALTSIYRLHGQTMLVSSSARFYSLAPTLAKSKLSEIENKAYSDLANDSGDYSDTYPGYKWSLQIEDVPTELITEKYYHITQIDVEISLYEENSYHLRTYRFFVD